MKRNPFVDSPLAEIAIEAALRAGILLREGFGTKFDIQAKSGLLNLVTQFDKDAEEAIISCISSRFPEHDFLAEESGSRSNQSKVLWIIDPLDGTMNFAHSIPIFTISIAAIVDQEVTVGVIYQPMTDELFIAQKGRKAFLNGIEISTSSVDNINIAIGATGFPYDLDNVREKAIEQFTHFLELGSPIRILGSAALNLAYVASGKLDMFWSSSLHPWDVAAGKLLIEEAGGKVTHFNGKPHGLFEDMTTLAANQHLHPTLMRKIDEFSSKD